MKNKTKSAYYQWLIFSIVIIAVVLINIIGHFTSFRIDMTSDNRYSLANGSVSYLKNIQKLENRINIKIYLEGDLPSELRSYRNSLEEKLKDFKRYAGDRIEYTFINPNEGSDEDKQVLFEQIYKKGSGVLPMEITFSKNAKETKLMLWPGAVLSFTLNGIPQETVVQLLPGTSVDRPFSMYQMPEVVEKGLNDLEYNLISALRRLSTLKKKKIGFLQGHGELNQYETKIARLLIAPYYNIQEVQLENNIHALDDFDGLIIADPKRNFSDKDLYLIDQFVMRGGDLMCFMNTLEINKDTLFRQGFTHSERKNIRLNDLLFDYGFKIKDNLIMDVNSIPKFDRRFNESRVDWYYQLLSTNTKHPTVKNIEPIALEFANQIEPIGENVIPVLKSSKNANYTGLAPIVELNMASNFDAVNPILSSEDKITNDLCFAATSNGKYKSYFNNRIVADFINNPDAKFLKESKASANIFVVSNGTFLANTYRMTQTRQGPKADFKGFNELKMNSDDVALNTKRAIGNQDFFLNIVDFVMGENYMLDIRSRQIDVREIDKSKIQTFANFYKTINIILPISIILLLGIFLNFFRRKRYKRN
jgi:gliding-associated putative ABC transporter substrate-binding component GldG